MLEPLAECEVFYFASTIAQATDAVSVLRHVGVRSCLVTLWREPSEKVSSTSLPPNIEQLDFSSSLPNGLHKLLTIVRCRSLVSRLAHRPAFPLLVFGNDANPIESATIRKARERGLKCLLVQDGFLDSQEELRFKHSFGLPSGKMVASKKLSGKLMLLFLAQTGLVPYFGLYGTGECNFIAVYGESTVSLLQERGVERNNLHITGASRFDLLFETHQSSEKRRKLNVLWLGLFLSKLGFGDQKLDKLWINGLRHAIQRGENLQITLRPHPSERVEWYKSELMENIQNKQLVLDQSTGIYDALIENDVVVTHYLSTVVLEALALGKPVYYLELGGNIQNVHDLLNYDVIRFFDRADQLVTCLAQLLSSDSMVGIDITEWDINRRDLLQHYLGYLDGNSSWRVAQLINKIQRDPNDLLA